MEQRARQLKTQLRAESARAAELDRLLQTYGRDAYKRLGFDPIANAAREQAEQQRHALVFTPSVPQAPNFAGAAAAHAAPPFAFQNPTKGGGVLTAGGGAVMPGFRYRLPPNLPGWPARAAPARPAASRPASASLSRPNRPESAGSARPASARMVR